MRYARDINGILVLNQNDVEELSERFLRSVAADCLSAPQFTPLASVVELLQGQGYLSFVASQSLGQTAAGQVVLGRYSVKSKTICIDMSLITGDDPRYSFTLAHELGHFYLHGGIKPSALGSRESTTIDDSAADIAAHRIESGTPRSLLEWQANRFAAGILVPRATLRDALVGVQTEMNIRKNTGEVWLDGNKSSRQDYATIRARLGQLYRTSMAVVGIRLHELGLVRCSRGLRSPTRIGHVLRELYGC